MQGLGIELSVFLSASCVVLHFICAAFNLKVQLDCVDLLEVLALMADLVRKGRRGSRAPQVAQVQLCSHLSLTDLLLWPHFGFTLTDFFLILGAKGIAGLKGERGQQGIAGKGE